MKKTVTLVAGLALVFVLAACGSATTAPGGGDAGAVPADPGPDTPVDDEDQGPGSGNGLLAGTTGDSPFFIETVDVRVAESYPVQLFLDVAGNAPTPGHTVAYSVTTSGDIVEVEITTQSGDGASATVLQPHTFVIPLGPAELPVTVTVNDGEWATTIEP